MLLLDAFSLTVYEVGLSGSLSLSQFFVSYVSRLRKFLQKELVIYLLFSIPASNNATLPTGEKEVQISLGG